MPIRNTGSGAPDMVTRIRKEVGNCAACQLLKAKMARAHQHFRAKVFCTPGRVGVATSTKSGRVKGYNNILGAVHLTKEGKIVGLSGQISSNGDTMFVARGSIKR